MVVVTSINRDTAFTPSSGRDGEGIHSQLDWFSIHAALGRVGPGWYEYGGRPGAREAGGRQPRSLARPAHSRAAQPSSTVSGTEWERCQRPDCQDRFRPAERHRRRLRASRNGGRADLPSGAGGAVWRDGRTVRRPDQQPDKPVA